MILATKCCYLCRGERQHNDVYDADYCPTCGVWLENKCYHGSGCQFCVNRPEVPPSLPPDGLIP